MKVLAKQRHVPEPVRRVVQDLSNGKDVSPQEFEQYVEESLE